MDGYEPRAKRQKMAEAANKAAATPIDVTAYRYNEKNLFSLLLQGGGLETPIIFDSPHTFAVLDKYPLSRGHALLIVKHPAATLLDDVPPPVAQAAFIDLQALVRAVQRATRCAGLHISQSNGPAAGQTVPQLHFHVIPVYTSPSPSPSSTTDPTPSSAALVTAFTPAPAPAASNRTPLTTSDAGPLLAHIRNLLPEAYSPGYHVWAATEADMEALGWALAGSPVAAAPGSVLALSGQLGAGKSTISRGFVRAFVRDPLLEVPSPTFLLCLSYQDDTAYERKEAEAAAAAGQEAAAQDAPGREAPGRELGDGTGAVGHSAVAAAEAAPPSAPGRPSSSSSLSSSSSSRASAVHHMDPYRLGAKNDKMAGLIDFEAALRRDVCLVEWPDRMPGSVMALAERGLALDVSGMGAQASGRLVTITPLGNRFKPPPPRAGKGAKAAAAAAAAATQAQPPAKAQPAEAAAAAGTAATSDGAASGADGPAAAAATSVADPSKPDSRIDPAAYEELLRTWRQAFPDRLPPADVAGASAVVGAGHLAGRSGAAGGASGGATTISAAAAAALAGGDPSEWLVLGIESSCDDTAAAVVRGDGTVLSHQVASQTGLHEQYGGVKPDVARQAHAAAIQATVDSALSAAGVEPGALTAVAATAGPGLALCLQVGVQHGLALAARYGLPYIPVHHMEAHAMMTRLPSVNDSPMQFPSLLLLVSGGHNMLVLCEGVGRHRIVGTTLDDSVGECFDKIARVAGITAVPGGPHLERLAASARPDAASRYPLTMPLANGAQRDSCNFSFSGLKTQVVTLIAQKRRELGLPDLPLPPAIAAERAAAAAAVAAAATGGGGDGATADADGDADGGAPGAVDGGGEGAGAAVEGAGKPTVEETAEEAARREAAEAEFTAACADIAASFQRTAVRFLQQRTRRALQWLREDAAQQQGPAAAAPGGFVRSLVVAGGVAANAAVRAGLSEVAAEFGLPCVYPPVRYCTDNGLMVAWTGVERLRLGLYQQPPRQCEGAGLEAHVQVIPRWPIGPMDPRSTANKGRSHIKLLH